MDIINSLSSSIMKDLERRFITLLNIIALIGFYWEFLSDIMKTLLRTFENECATFVRNSILHTKI